MYYLCCVLVLYNIKRKLVSKEVERRTEKTVRKSLGFHAKKAKKEGNKKKERQNTYNTTHILDIASLMGKTTRSPRKLLKKKHIVCSYQTPKSKLKSALKKSGNSRYASHHRVKEEEEENRNRLIFPPAGLCEDEKEQIQKTPLRNHVNFADEKEEKEEKEERLSEEEDAWNFDLTTTTEKKNSKKKNLPRPPPTPSTPFHFARDFFERGCESDAEEQSTTASSECGKFRFDFLDDEKEEEKNVKVERVGMAMTPRCDDAKARQTSSSYLAGQRDAFKDVLLQESLPLQKLVERQKQKVEVLTKMQEKMEDEVREQSIVSAVLIELTNVEKEHVVRMEEMGAKLCASAEKLEKEVIVLKSTEKERKVAPKMQKFLEKCVGFGAFFLGKEARSMLLESPVSKKLFEEGEEEEGAETPTPSTPPKRERTGEELATCLAMCVALEAIAKMEASKLMPIRAPLPIRLGVYLSRVYFWSEFLGAGHRVLATRARNTAQLIVLASRIPPLPPPPLLPPLPPPPANDLATIQMVLEKMAFVRGKILRSCS